MTYLRNAWTVAAWSAELASGALLARTLLDEPLVLFRDDAGRAQALTDRCPHRFAPLSMGQAWARRTSGHSSPCCWPAMQARYGRAESSTH